MKKRIIAFLLLTLCLVQIPLTTYADSGTSSQKRTIETYKDLVPEDKEAEEFQCLLLGSLSDLSMTNLSSDYGVAYAYVVATTDYNFTDQDYDVDVLADSYVGIYRNWVEIMFCSPKDEYICVIYDRDKEIAAYYLTGVYTGDEAAEILKNSLPNQDCTKVKKSVVEEVIEKLLEVMTDD